VGCCVVSTGRDHVGAPGRYTLSGDIARDYWVGGNEISEIGQWQTNPLSLWLKKSRPSQDGRLFLMLKIR
jgi:hypothetical protein